MIKRLLPKYVTAVVVALLLFFAGIVTAEARGLLSPRDATDDTADKTSTEKTYTAEEIKSLVQDEFGGEHPMVDVARCESSFRQFRSDGDVVRNPESDAIGIFQILEGLHEEPADKLGFDIFTVDGNIGYARKLYDSFGLAPWSPSSLCWDDGNVEATDLSGETSKDESTRVPVRVRGDSELVRKDAGGSSYVSADFDDNTDETEDDNGSSNVREVITKKLVSGVNDPQVKRLQELLNDLGFRLAGSGPGSPDQETTFFGAKTRAAVKEFQCEKDIVCSGGRYTTGYGLVDKETREALNKAAAELRPGEYRFGDLRVRTDQSEASESQEESSDQRVEGVQNDSRPDKQTRRLINRLQDRVTTLQLKIKQ